MRPLAVPRVIVSEETAHTEMKGTMAVVFPEIGLLGFNSFLFFLHPAVWWNENTSPSLHFPITASDFYLALVSATSHTLGGVPQAASPSSRGSL